MIAPKGQYPEHWELFLVTPYNVAVSRYED